MNEKIAVIGLGYVGLPVALGAARAFPGTIGFDINEKRVTALAKGEDATGEVDAAELKKSTIRFTHDPSALDDVTFFIVAVPTPVDQNRRPDLTPLRRASETVGKHLKRGAIVCYESTVYPGVTEEFCGPILAEHSKLTQGVDFQLGYSPERINPGDREHTLERIVKVVAAQDEASLARVSKVYGGIVPAGLFTASSIRVAEAAKAVENTQRDLNIALMNELAIICDRMGIATKDVLAAARTKWNFLPFAPGLVGGHCIGVDPYYLTFKAEELGYHPEVILAGRRINDSMAAYVGQKTVKLLLAADRPLQSAKVAVLGLTFKENVPDLRNSKVPDLLAELRQFGVQAMVHDAVAEPHDALEEYGIELSSLDAMKELDALVLAVPHREYLEQASALFAKVRPGGVVVDLKSALPASALRSDLRSWSL